jgi:putative flippase GtrA
MTSRALHGLWPALSQLVRYGVVGLAVNSTGYLVYLVVTMRLEPKLAVTLLYPVAVLIGYLSHARYSFRFAGRKAWALARYVTAYATAYGVNELMLYGLTDRLGFPHQAVQAAAIFVNAGLLFLLLKFFVFPQPRERPRRAPDG